MEEEKTLALSKKEEKEKKEKEMRRKMRRKMCKIWYADLCCVLAAVVGIIVLESFALHQGINGTALILAIGALAGLGGYEVDNIIMFLKGGKGGSQTSLIERKNGLEM